MSICLLPSCKLPMPSQLVTRRADGTCLTRNRSTNSSSSISSLGKTPKKTAARLVSIRSTHVPPCNPSECLSLDFSDEGRLTAMENTDQDFAAGHPSAPPKILPVACGDLRAILLVERGKIEFQGRIRAAFSCSRRGSLHPKSLRGI